MDIIVKAKNCEVSGRLKEQAVERVEHATRFFDRLITIEMVFSSEANPRIAEPAGVELTAHTKGHYIRAVGVGVDHRGAVEMAASRFERQLSRYKARMVDRAHGQEGHHRSAGSDELPASADRKQADEDVAPRIVRTKQFQLSPMLPEEAAVQLELLGHEFFLFAHAISGDCAVVYRRKDGELGLIEATTGSE